MGLKYSLYLKCYFLKYIIITCRGSLENSSNKDILHTVVVNLSPISNSLFNFTVIFNQNSIVGGINFNLIEWIIFWRCFWWKICYCYELYSRASEFQFISKAKAFLLGMRLLALFWFCCCLISNLAFFLGKYWISIKYMVLW